MSVSTRVLAFTVVLLLALAGGAAAEHQPAHKQAAPVQLGLPRMIVWYAPTTTTAPPTPHRTAPAPSPRAHYVTTPLRGDFASCVRQKESSNNYGYSGYYHGAYNMTLSHWSGYGGYSSPESAPPAVQDAKFASDVAQGSAYMHQQYPVTSRACGL